MLKFCFLKSSIPIKDEICTKITSVLFPTLNDMILAETPENLCSNAAVLFVEPKKQELENFEGTGCDICLMVVMKIDEAHFYDIITAENVGTTILLNCNLYRELNWENFLYQKYTNQISLI